MLLTHSITYVFIFASKNTPRTAKMSQVPQWYIELCNVLLEVRNAKSQEYLSRKCCKVLGFTKALSALNVITSSELELIQQVFRNASTYAHLEIDDRENYFNPHYQDGIDAYFDKKSQSENPHPVDSKAYQLWESGYKYARLLPF